MFALCKLHSWSSVHVLNFGVLSLVAHHICMCQKRSQLAVLIHFTLMSLRRAGQQGTIQRRLVDEGQVVRQG